MTHLTPAELIDAVDATLPAARRAHLDTCEHCRQETHGLQTLLGEVRDVEVPEPSPLFWDHFTARVEAAVSHDVPSAPPARWFHWATLAPLAGLALMVLALLSALQGPTTNPAPQPADLAAVSAADDTADTFETQWALLADLVDGFPVDDVDETGLPAGPGVADRAALQLSLDEQQELMRLLREELRVGG